MVHGSKKVVMKNGGQEVGACPCAPMHAHAVREPKCAMIGLKFAATHAHECGHDVNDLTIVVPLPRSFGLLDMCGEDSHVGPIRAHLEAGG
jgi:hypothetical protein